MKRASKLRRSRINYLCDTMECSIEDLLREHRTILSHALVREAQRMFREVNGRYFWVDHMEREHGR
jgi:hypothetical protein